MEYYSAKRRGKDYIANDLGESLKNRLSGGKKNPRKVKCSSIYRILEMRKS